MNRINDSNKAMETIKRFNASLSSLYDDKLPVSKNKISEITRVALDGLRVYKHIVQSVERFIHRCRPEFKLPALYVIDSIVRNSQQEFRKDRDVYGQRFTRNLQTTFQNLFSTCLLEDKPKIVRVLNLWQKNKVFPPDVIQPLLDLAQPDMNVATTLSINSGMNSLFDDSIMNQYQAQSSSTSSSSLLNKYRSNISQNTNHNLEDYLSIRNDDDSNLNESKNLGHNFDDENAKQELIDQLFATFSQIGNINNNKNYHRNNIPYLELNDANDDEDDDDISTPTEAEPPYPKIKSKLKNKSNADKKWINLLEIFQPQPQQQPNESNEFNDQKIDNLHQRHHHTPPHPHSIEDNSDSNQESLLQKFLNSTAVAGASAAAAAAASSSSVNHHHQSQSDDSSHFGGYPPQSEQLDSPSIVIPDLDGHHQRQQLSISRRSRSSRGGSISPKSPDRHHRSHRHRSRSIHRDRSYRRSDRYSNNRSPSRDFDTQRHSSSTSRRRRSRSHRKDTGNNSRRNNSRSRSRSKSSNDSRYSENNADLLERERLREKHRKGYPAIRKDCMTICSTTLWIGHLPKRTTSEMDLNDLFGEFGVINSIDLIPSRGCAYVCMDRRQDAYRAYGKIKPQSKILGSNQVKITWAPGKGMKNKEYKDYWEADIGCSFIPHSKMSEDLDLDQLEEGGMIDEDTIPEKFKELRKRRRQEKKEKEQQQQQQQQLTSVEPSLMYAAATVPGVVNPLIAPHLAAYAPPPPPPPPLPVPPPPPPQALLPVPPLPPPTTSEAVSSTNLIHPHLNAHHHPPLTMPIPGHQPQPSLLGIPPGATPFQPPIPSVFPGGIASQPFNTHQHNHSTGLLPPPHPPVSNPWAPPHLIPNPIITQGGVPRPPPVPPPPSMPLQAPLRPPPPPPMQQFYNTNSNFMNVKNSDMKPEQQDENNARMVEAAAATQETKNNDNTKTEDVIQDSEEKVDLPEIDVNDNKNDNMNECPAEIQNNDNVWDPIRMKNSIDYTNDYNNEINNHQINNRVNSNNNNKRRRTKSRFDNVDEHHNDFDHRNHEPMFRSLPPPPQTQLFPDPPSGVGAGPLIIQPPGRPDPMGEQPLPHPFVPPDSHHHHHHQQFPPRPMPPHPPNDVYRPPPPPHLFNNPNEFPFPKHHSHGSPSHHMIGPGPDRFGHPHHGGPPPPDFGNYPPSPPRMYDNRPPPPFHNRAPLLPPHRGPHQPPPPHHRFGPPMPPNNRPPPPFWHPDQGPPPPPPPPMVINNQRRDRDFRRDYPNGRFQKRNNINWNNNRDHNNWRHRDRSTFNNDDNNNNNDDGKHGPEHQQSIDSTSNYDYPNNDQSIEKLPNQNNNSNDENLENQAEIAVATSPPNTTVTDDPSNEL